MNSEVSSSEHELSQDGSSQDDSNEKSVSSHTSNESLNQAELSDKPEVEPQLKNDSVDTSKEQSSTNSDLNTKVPKMAEEAMYMHIAYSILAGRSGVQEYIVQRFKRDRSAQLRNAKIRLSNMKLGEMIQNMRGKSKWLKF